MPSATHKLIDFWRNFFPKNNKVMVHQKDETVVQAFQNNPNNKRKDGENDFNYLSRDGLKLELPPFPILGDLKNAKVVICMLNPGVNTSDLKVFSDSKLKKRLENNLKQNFSDVEFPFPFLDPDLCWTGGFRWWHRKFKHIVGNDLEKMKHASNHVAAVELFAYPSVSFNSHKLLEHTQSTILAKNWFEEAKANTEKLIVVGRSAGEWGLTGEFATNGGYDEKNALALLPKNKRQGGNFSKEFEKEIQKFLGYKD